MKRFVRPLTFLILLISIHSKSQSGYYYAFINLNDSLNKTIQPLESDRLPEILIDGYLKGKIKAYQFDVGREVLKRGPVPDQPKWDPKQTYFVGDLVSYEGTIHEVVFDMTSEAPTNKYHWKKVLGEPISSRYYFPTVTDTLSKTDFLKRMVMKEPSSYPEWDSDVLYYGGDIVSYKGKAYQAFAGHDFKGLLPTDKNYWSQINNDPLFYSTRMDGIKMLVYRKQENDKSVSLPQMISLLANGDGQLMDIGLAFYYNDVLKYLSTVPQPILYNNGIGYVGNQVLILNANDRWPFLRWLSTQLKSGSLKVKKTSVINATVYDQFMRETGGMTEMDGWSAHQDFLTQDILLSQSYYDNNNYKAKTFMRLPIKDVEKLLSAQPKPTLLNYTQFLRSFNPPTDMEPLLVESLAPLEVSSVPDKAANAHYFVVDYSAQLSVDNPIISAAISEAWSVIAKSFYEKQIQFKASHCTYYPCIYNWKNMVIEGSDYSWTCPDQFTIGPNLKTQIDSLPTPSKFDVLTVRYKKWLNTQPAKAKFEATQITLNIDYKVKPPAYDERVDKSADIIGHTSYTLNWNEIKKILSSKNSPNFNAFINTVEKGELKFYDSNVAYGLIEDK